MASNLEDVFEGDQRNAINLAAKEQFKPLIQKSQYVGEVYSISYETALVQIHDFNRRQVGGIPSLSFLIATRINPEEPTDYKTEDASIILLRVMDAASLPNAFEAERVRVESAQRASGEDIHWDSPDLMDASTHQLLSYAGVKCKVVGTFFLDRDPNNESPEALVLRFGSDLSNYYPNRGLKVYKPNDRALSRIVNYRDPERKDILTSESVMVGYIRYASTNRSFQGVSNVEVQLLPADLLGQKTALFGMTRTGKSNTTKIILQSVFDLRFTQQKALRIGQLVFDPNGEYANENSQDPNKGGNPSAIKNIWKSNPNGNEADVITYGILSHPNDPKRKLMLLNFFNDSNLQIGKEIINSSLEFDNAKFVQNFIQVSFSKPDKSDYSVDSSYYSALTRYNRRVLVYRALLVRAGFSPPQNLVPVTKGLFSPDLLTAMRSSNSRNSPDHISAATIISQEKITWSQLGTALIHLYDFMMDSNSGYRAFEQAYVSQSTSGETWADEDLKKILEMSSQRNGSRQNTISEWFMRLKKLVAFKKTFSEILLTGLLVI
jgi:hypothetical protein